MQFTVWAETTMLAGHRWMRRQGSDEEQEKKVLVDLHADNCCGKNILGTKHLQWLVIGIVVAIAEERQMRLLKIRRRWCSPCVV
jgi:hypothetical protein